MFHLQGIGNSNCLEIKTNYKNLFRPNVINEFIKMCENNILGMKEYIIDVVPNTNVKIILGDSTKDNGIPANSIDFIITSPRMVIAELPLHMVNFQDCQRNG